MITKINKFLYGALLLCLPAYISANLTTMQSWDPIPFYNAANLNMPPDTHFCYLLKQRLLDEATDKRRRWGINVSPFVQRAIRAQQTETSYFGISNPPQIIIDGVPVPGTPGAQMSDYQGTPYLMGLFLGQDVNGNSIWGDASAVDTGNVNDITLANVEATLLPQNLKNAVIAMNDISSGTAGNNAIIYYTPTQTTGSDGLSPSIFSENVLEADETYFGAFSTPMTYQKAGFRWEVNLDITDDFGFLIRGGVCEIVQRVTTPTPLAGLAPNPMPASQGYLATGNNTTTTGTPPSLYGGLNIKANGVSNTVPVTIAQSTYNEYISNNIEDLFDPINGIDLNYETFAQAGVEDMQFLGFWRHAFTLHPTDPNKYASIIVTPYAMAGCTVPLAPVQDYSKFYALPFGNNSHISVGGVVGVTFDFIESIEFGFEFGATGFLEKTILGMPCPNHILQRVIYPYRQDMIVQPGYNGQFAFIFNAFEFAQNTSFSFRYNYVQHTTDSYTLVTPSPYFLPSQLEINSPWVSQMFIAALTFELQPSIYLSAAWQGALSQRNAYCSNTIMVSINALF